MPKNQQPKRPATAMDIIIKYVLPIIIVAIIAISVPYFVLCFIKHRNIIWDISIFANKILWISTGIITLCFALFALGISIYYDLFGHTKMLNKTEDAISEVYGNSRFLTEKEIFDLFGNYDFSKLGNIETSGYIINSARKGKILNLSLVPQQHALISGVSGDGKSLRHLGVTIQANAKSKTKPSMFINDIKGELWNMHSQFLREQGYDTILIDLKNPYSSYRLNPLNIIWKLKERAENISIELTNDELDKAYFEYRILKGQIDKTFFIQNNYTSNVPLGKIIDDELEKTINTIKNLKEKDFPTALIEAPLNKFLNINSNKTSVQLYHLYLSRYKFFRTLKENLSRDEFYAEWQNNQLCKKMDNLNRASALIIEYSRIIVPEGTGENKQWADGAQGVCAGIITAMLEDGFNKELNFTEEMFTITQISNIVNRQKNELNEFLKLRNASSKAFDFAGPILDNPAEKTVAGYMSNLQTPLRNYLEDGIEYLMSGTDIDLSNIIAQPTAIFILVPEEFPTRNTIASMFITQVYNELLHQSNDYADLNYKLPRPFYFFWDEFGNSVKIPEFPSWITLSRSRNIYFGIYVQALSQINKIYGDADTKTIVQNCHLQIIMGSNEDDTIEHYRKAFGEHTIITRTANFDPKTPDIDFKGSSTLSKVDLVPASFLRKIPAGTIYWKLHKINPGKTHIELIYDNTDILSIGAYDKPAETYKPYDKEARIYNIKDRNNYIQNVIANSKVMDIIDDDNKEIEEEPIVDNKLDDIKESSTKTSDWLSLTIPKELYEKDYAQSKSFILKGGNLDGAKFTYALKFITETDEGYTIGIHKDFIICATLNDVKIDINVVQLQQALNGEIVHDIKIPKKPNGGGDGGASFSMPQNETPSATTNPHHKFFE